MISAALAGGVHATASAAGLGRLTVQSALGQPLQAQVEITSLSRDELASLSAKLAPVDAFRQAGIEPNPALASLRFAIDRQPDGRAYVRITSGQPINEPFVDLLVELNWAAGRFVREYTFLLDPPELRIGRETVEGNTVLAQVTPPAASAPSRATSAGTNASSPARATAAVAPAAPTAPQRATPARTDSPSAAPATSPAPSQSAAPASDSSAPGTVTVERGETLASIAARVKPADVAVEQAIVAIYNANPSAFFGTVHQMRAGRTLNIPESSAMQAVDAAEARRQIRVQAGDFNAYRQRLAATVRKVDTAQAGTSATGAVTAKVDETGAGAGAGDQLKLSRGAGSAGAASAGTGTATGTASGQTAAEAGIAGNAALREQEERVALLEKNLADLQRMLELKNRQLAELQQQVESALQAPRSASGSVAQAPAASMASAAASAGPSAGSAPATTSPSTSTSTAAAGPSASSSPTGPGASPGVDASSTSGASSAGSNPSDTASQSAGTSSTSTTTARSDSAAPSSTLAPAAAGASAAGTAPAGSADGASPAAPVTAPAARPVPVPERSFIDELLANPLTVPGLGALAIALGAYGWYTLRRRRKTDSFEDSLIAADAFTANSLFGTTGGQAVDTSNQSMFGPSVRDTSADAHSTEVDPIAEAEVYIAYGREAQAEEILREALKRQPERQAIRLKLLEICAGRKDAVGFGLLAQQMYDLSSGRNEEWPKVVTMGLSLDPDNPLYAGGGEPGAIAGFDADELEPTGVGDGNVDTAMRAIHAAASPESVQQFDAFYVDNEASERLEVGVPAPRVSQGEPAGAGAPRDFAETRGMNDKETGDPTPALDFSLDVDTSIGRPDEITAASAAPADPDADGEQSELERALGGRFDLPTLDFGVAATTGASAAAAAAAGAAASGETDEAEQLSSYSARRAPAEAPAFAELGDFRIDLPSLENFDLQGKRSSEAIGFGDAALDMGDTALDLASLDVVPAGGGSAQWQEMATKLDLASAYEEIGDKDGARELLEEVVRGGDGDQKRRAEAMLSKIG